MHDEREKPFRNRRDAGEQLARFLQERVPTTNTLVVGIPRGGVEVAYQVARQIGLPFSLIVSKKLPYPGQPEFGFGAVSEEHRVYVNQKARNTLPPATIADIIDQQTDEVSRRVLLYRQGNPLPDMRGKTVVVVDDGIATGVTLVPVLELCRQRRAGRIIIAAPVSGRHFDEHLHEADAIEVLVRPQPFYGVGQAYESFGDFTDEELLALLDDAPWI